MNLVKMRKRVVELEKEKAVWNQSQKTIQEIEASYRLLLSAESDAIVIVDARTKQIVDANDSALKLYGYSREEILQLNAIELSAEPEKSTEHIKKVARGKLGVVSPGPIQRIHKNKDGAIFPVEIVYWVFAQQDRKMIYAIFRDISKQKQAEEALRESEERFRVMFEISHDLITIVDEKAQTIWANPAWRKTTGYTPETQGDPIKSIHPDDRDRVIQAWQSISDDANTFSRVEYRYRTAKGSYISLETTARQCVIAGKPLLYVLAHDVTERKKAEEAFRKHEKNLKNSQRLAKIGSWDWDLESNVLIWSDEMYYIFKVDKTCTPSFDLIKNVFHPDDLWMTDDEEFQKIMNSSPLEINHRIIDQTTKEVKYIHMWGETTYDSNGKPVRVTGTIQDITERKLLEEHLNQSQKIEAIGTLAGGIAHDFNNMLGVITGNISYALSQIDQNGELCEVLTNAQEGARQAQNLTHQLITFAKGGSPIIKSANIRQIIEESTKFVLSGTKVQCDFKFPDDLSPVKVDPVQINQVFTNLILNATQAMPDGGTIQIQAENNDITTGSNIPLKPGKYIKIMVIDKGIGISEKHIPKIFDPYFSTKRKGKGLGLATTHSILDKHNGYIFAESQIDKGTTFHIYLPASIKTVEQVKETKKPESVPCKGHGRILIMDDQELVLEILAKMLNKMGYEPVLATDGAQAIALFREACQSSKPFDVVILDLTVPGGMGGAKTIPELLKIDPKVKAVVSSGYSNDPIMSNYEDYGFCEVIPKPYSMDEMARLINKILNDLE